MIPGLRLYNYSRFARCVGIIQYYRTKTVASDRKSNANVAELLVILFTGALDDSMLRNLFFMFWCFVGVVGHYGVVLGFDAHRLATFEI